MKGSWGEIRTGRFYSPTTTAGKDPTQGNGFNLLLIRAAQQDETQILKTPFPHSSFLPKLNFTPQFLYLLFLSSVVSPSHTISAAPFSARGVLPTVFP